MGDTTKDLLTAARKAVEVLVFKGRKRISIDCFIASNDDFFSIFKKAYER